MSQSVLHDYDIRRAIHVCQGPDGMDYARLLLEIRGLVEAAVEAERKRSCPPPIGLGIQKQSIRRSHAYALGTQLPTSDRVVAQKGILMTTAVTDLEPEIAGHDYEIRQILKRAEGSNGLNRALLWDEIRSMVDRVRQSERERALPEETVLIRAQGEGYNWCRRDMQDSENYLSALIASLVETCGGEVKMPIDRWMGHIRAPRSVTRSYDPETKMEVFTLDPETTVPAV